MQASWEWSHASATQARKPIPTMVGLDNGATFSHFDLAGALAGEPTKDDQQRASLMPR
jgi:hypothetical protein